MGLIDCPLDDLSRPGIQVFDDHNLLFYRAGARGHSIIRLEIETGKELWSKQLSGRAKYSADRVTLIVTKDYR